MKHYEFTSKTHSFLDHPNIMLLQGGRGAGVRSTQVTRGLGPAPQPTDQPRVGGQVAVRAHLCSTPGRVPRTAEVQLLRCSAGTRVGTALNPHRQRAETDPAEVATRVALDTSLAQDPCSGRTLPTIAPR